jgi:hypothetical protein
LEDEISSTRTSMAFLHQIGLILNKRDLNGNGNKKISNKKK